MNRSFLFRRCLAESIVCLWAWELRWLCFSSCRVLIRLLCIRRLCLSRLIWIMLCLEALSLDWSMLLVPWSQLLWLKTQEERYCCWCLTLVCSFVWDTSPSCNGCQFNKDLRLQLTLHLLQLLSMLFSLQLVAAPSLGCTLLKWCPVKLRVKQLLLPLP